MTFISERANIWRVDSVDMTDGVEVVISMVVSVAVSVLVSVVVLIVSGEFSGGTDEHGKGGSEVSGPKQQKYGLIGKFNLKIIGNHDDWRPFRCSSRLHFCRCFCCCVSLEANFVWRNSGQLNNYPQRIISQLHWLTINKQILKNYKALNSN